MALVKIEGFTGVAPRIDPKKLPEGGAQLAERCVFEGGDLRPLRLPLAASTPLAAPRPRTIWQYHEGGRWLSSGSFCSVVRSPVVGDQWARVYWTDDSFDRKPRFAVRDQLMSNTNLDSVAAELGITRPTSKPNASASSVSAEVTAQTMSQTSPVRVTTSEDHPFEDGHRVIVTLERAGGTGDAPDPRTSMVEIVGKTYTVKTTGNAGTGAVNRREFDLIGADGTNFSEYNPSLWRARIKRVFTDADTESRTYVYTLVSQYGEESQPSDPSDVVDVVKGAKVTVSGMQAPAGQGYTIRIYRSVTGPSGTNFFFVGERASGGFGGVTFDDTVKFEALGEMLPSETWAPPISGMRGLTVMPGGFLVAFKGNTLYFSEPHMPHAWPHAYRRTVQDEIVGIGVFSQTLVVATRGKPYLASGADPSSVSLQQLDDHAPCVNGRCLTATGTGVIYPTLDGLVHVSTAGVRRMTQGYFTRQQWELLCVSPSVAIWHNGRYVLSRAGGMVLFQPEGNVLHISELGGETAEAMAISTETMSVFGDDIMFFLKAGNPTMYAFDRGNVAEAYWVSKVVSLPRPVSLACGQVIASAYPVKIVLHAARIPQGSQQPPSLAYPSGRTEVHTQFVQGPEPFRLPSGFVAREWRVEISTTNSVQAVYLASSMDEIKQI